MKQSRKTREIYYLIVKFDKLVINEHNEKHSSGEENDANVGKGAI